MTSEAYIYKKEIDWSVLHLGINIPVSLQDIFYDNMKIRLKKGESRKIKLMIENNEYIVTLTNISFDSNKYPNHKELLQIRYSPNSDIAKMMRMTFYKSYNYLYAKKEQFDNKRTPLSVPQNQREYVTIYTTPVDDTLFVDCITSKDIVQTRKTFTKYSELELEQLINSTDTPSIIEKTGIGKIRKMDKSISDKLKITYGFKCQICGLYIGELYDAQVIHAHHIEYFSTSLNNNIDNIIVICPNHHGIIHTTNPVFNRENKSFIYPNGFVEGLKLNFHL